VHCLHVLALAVLGYFVWQDLRRDGEDRLFESMNITHGFAQAQMVEAHEKMFDLMLRQTEAYRTTHNLAYMDRVIRINRFCDSVMQLVKDGRLLPSTRNHHLSLLKDSLHASVDDDPYFTRQFDALLLPSGVPDLAKRFSNARTAQQTMLRNDLQINILLAKVQALNYFLQQVAGCDLRFDVFLPFWQPDVICPAAQEAFTATCFLSSYSSFYFLRPRSAKVWINGAGIPLKDGYATFNTRFDKKGPQPLAVRVELRDWKSDFLRVFEKSYTVNVK